MSFGLSCLCVLVVFAHLTESRLLILRDINNEPLSFDHKESQEELILPVEKLPVITTVNTPKRIRSSKKTIYQFGRQVYHLGNGGDTEELRSKQKPKSISYDYFDIGKLKSSTNAVKKGMGQYLNEILVLSDAPPKLCYEQRCADDLRKYNKKYKDNDETKWKHKKMQIPLGHMKRFQIVDNIHNSVRNPKFGSEEYHGKKKNKVHKKKDSSASNESGSGSEEANSEMSEEKEEEKKSEEIIFEKEESADNSIDVSKNQDEDSKSVEDIPKKKSKKKKKQESSDKTKRKTIPLEDTYFMQGNKIFHSTGRSKKKHHDDARRSRLEHFMPKRYHWDPSEIHDLGYYWFNGPKGMYSDPRVLSK